MSGAHAWGTLLHRPNEIDGRQRSNSTKSSNVDIHSKRTCTRHGSRRSVGAAREPAREMASGAMHTQTKGISKRNSRRAGKQASRRARKLGGRQACNLSSMAQRYQLSLSPPPSLSPVIHGAAPPAERLVERQHRDIGEVGHARNRLQKPKPLRSHVVFQSAHRVQIQANGSRRAGVRVHVDEVPGGKPLSSRR